MLMRTDVRKTDNNGVIPYRTLKIKPKFKFFAYVFYPNKKHCEKTGVTPSFYTKVNKHGAPGR